MSWAWYNLDWVNRLNCINAPFFPKEKPCRKYDAVGDYNINAHNIIIIAVFSKSSRNIIRVINK